MKNLKKYSILLVVILILVTTVTSSYASIEAEYNTNKNILTANSNEIISGVCKVYNNGTVVYKKKNSEGKYGETATQAEAIAIRNKIKQAIDSVESGKYVVAKIAKNNAYYNSTNKEFCFKRDYSINENDTVEEVVLLGYDDNYVFKSDLTSNNGAYKVRRAKETEFFYVSYDDTWIESEIVEKVDADGIELDKTDVQLEVGETIEVYYSVYPENALMRNVTISYTGNIEIDKETFGVVKITALEEGDAYIIVKLKVNNNVTAKCDIKVVSKGDNPTPNPSPNPTDDLVSSNKFLVDKNKEYISKVMPKTTINNFKTNITCKSQYQIEDKNGVKIDDLNTIVATGMKLAVENKKYTIVVKGDINGDGIVNLSDVIKANLHFAKLRFSSNEIEKISADVTGDGIINLLDIIKINLTTANLKGIE